MIQINNISKAFAGDVLLDEASFIIAPGEKIGLIGRNGSGKSTLFRMIQGVEPVDSGDIVIPKHYMIGALDQHIEFTKPSVLEECIQSLREEEQYDHYKAEKILSGLGFSDEDFHKDPYTFSGGYQVRISLTKALLKSPELLLLDEPTNYLDIVSIRWLKGFLKTYPSEMVIITHDRSFMDSVVTHVIGIKRKQVRKIKGQTSKYYEQMAQEEILHEQTRVNIDKKRKEIQGFVDRFRASAAKATQAQSKIKQLEKMGSLDKLENESDMSLHFPFKKCPSKTLMNIEDISFSYSKDSELLFKNLSLEIGREDRIAIIGKNGKGKSTLLNVIAGELKSNSGEIKKHDQVLFGHFGQTNINRLSLKSNIVDEIHSANSSLTTTQARSIAGSMMFKGDTADKKISVLSGGERSRVLLGKILANPANLLLLDEPTNHLDIESVEVLTQEIKNYPGALLLVTHNEMMLNKLVNKIVVFREGNAEVFLGSYKEFLNKVGWGEESTEETLPEKKPTLSYKEKKARRSELVKERSQKRKPLKKTVTEAENKITQLEEKLEILNADLLKASEEQNQNIIIECTREIANCNKNIEKWFLDLEECSVQLEELEKEYEPLFEELDN